MGHVTLYASKDGIVGYKLLATCSSDATLLYYCSAIYLVISCLHIISKLTAIHLVVPSVPYVILFALLFFRFCTDDSGLSVILLNHYLLTYLLTYLEANVGNITVLLNNSNHKQ